MSKANIYDEITAAIIESIENGAGVKVNHRGSGTFYSPTSDSITMPEKHLFTGSNTITADEAYNATLLHEATHASGHSSRLDRNLNDRFGSEGYAAEELIAEMGAAFLCAKLNITNEPRADHAQYIEHWLKILSVFFKSRQTG